VQFPEWVFGLTSTRAEWFHQHRVPRFAGPIRLRRSPCRIVTDALQCLSRRLPADGNRASARRIVEIGEVTELHATKALAEHSLETGSDAGRKRARADVMLERINQVDDADIKHRRHHPGP